MNQQSTIFLRAVIALIGLIVLGVCLFGLPVLIQNELQTGNDFDYGYIFIGLYVTAIPFFIALYQAMRLLGYIDRNKAFTNQSVDALKAIMRCGVIISSLFIVGMPYIFYVADRDDAPGVALIGFIIIGASLVVSAAAALFQQLFSNAIDIKSENDLTV